MQNANAFVINIKFHCIIAFLKNIFSLTQFFFFRKDQVSRVNESVRRTVEE